MPPVSKAQTRFMYATAEGKTDVSPSVGKEFTADVPKGLPDHVQHAQGKLGGKDAAAHSRAHSY